MKVKVVRILKRIYKLFKKEKSEVEMYRKRGVKIGEGTELYSVAIDGCFGHLITIGKNCIITHSSIQAHDASTKLALGYSKVARISIGDNCYIGWNCIILPGVEIGNNVIIGAGSIVTRNIPNGSVACGNPARVIGTYDNYIEKNRKLLNEGAPVYNTIFFEKTYEEKQIQYKELSDGKFGFDL